MTTAKPFQTADQGFARLGWSTLAAQMAEQVALAAAPLVAVLLLDAGPAETGLLQAAQTLPFLLLSIPVGILIDRASKRNLMVVGEALRALSIGGLIVLLLAGRLDLPLLAGLGFVGAVGTVCFSVAAPAFVPLIVPRDELTSANRWLELARSGAFVAGPALGGALVGWTSASLAYGIAIALSLLAVGLLMTLTEPTMIPPPRRSVSAELREGLAFVVGHPFLRPICLTAMFFNLSWFVMQGVFTPYAIGDLGLDASGVGLILGTYGAGLLLGAVLTPALGRVFGVGRLILIGPLCGAAGAVLMLSTLWLPSGVLAAAGYFLFGAGPMIWTITTMSLRQAVTPNQMLGRVSAVIVTATTGAAPLGAALGAFVADRFGIGACLYVAMAGFLIQLGIIAASEVRGLKTLPTGPVATA